MIEQGPTQPEYTRYFKPENNDGCGCGGDKSCDAPSNATEGSPRWEWEQVYGKLVTYFYKEHDANGHSFIRIERNTCPIEANRPRQQSCCSLRYKVLR